MPGTGAEGMLRRCGRGQSAGRGVNRVGVSRGRGSPAGRGAPGLRADGGQCPSVLGQGAARMDGAEGSPQGAVSGARSGGRGGSGVGVMRPAGQGPGTLLVATVPVTCETNPHPCSSGLALPCPGAGLDSWAMEPQSPLSAQGRLLGLPPAAELGSTESRPSGRCGAIASRFMGTASTPHSSLSPSRRRVQHPVGCRHVLTG